MVKFDLYHDTNQDDAARIAIDAVNKALREHGLQIEMDYGEGGDGKQDYILDVKKT